MTGSDLFAIGFIALLLFVVVDAVRSEFRERRLFRLVSELSASAHIRDAMKERPHPAPPPPAPPADDEAEWEDELAEMRRQAAGYVPPTDRRRELLEQAQALRKAQERMMVPSPLNGREFGAPDPEDQEPIS